jgi:predicted hotdog family 3-hydroxylacyl-ACP dehydratase
VPVIGRDEILRHVPHAGRMCLIDDVASWDANGIVCIARNHRSVDHPLRRFGRLSSVHLIEYGAQAMAIHGALLEHVRGAKSQPGMLVAARDFRTTVDRLDALDGPLTIEARPQMTRPGALIYEFRCVHAGSPIASGRVTVMLS